MEYLINLLGFRKAEQPSKEQLCDEICRLVQLKARLGFVLKGSDNTVILNERAFIDDLNPQIWDKEKPVIVAHIFEQGLRGRPIDSLRLTKVNQENWLVETWIPPEEIKDKWVYQGVRWWEISGKEARRRLSRLLKSVENSTPHRFY